MIENVANAKGELSMSDEFFHNNNPDGNDNLESNSSTENNFNNDQSSLNNYNGDYSIPKESEQLGINDAYQPQDPSVNDADQNKEPMNQGPTYSFWAEQIAASRTNTENGDQTNQNNTDQTYNSYYNSINQEKRNQNYGNDQNNYDSNMESPKKVRKRPRFIGKAIKYLCGAAIFGIIAGAAFVGFNIIYYQINPDAAAFTINIGKDGAGTFHLGTSSNTEVASTTTVSDKSIKQDTDVSEVVSNTMPSIVSITSTISQSYNFFGQEYNQEGEGSGSGIIVGDSNGQLLIVTNNHVVSDAKTISIKFIDDSQVEATVKGTDSSSDLAVIAVDKSKLTKDTLGKIKVATLGDSNSVQVGEMAIAIGNALGYGQSVTVGYISAKDREVSVNENKMVLLQTDAAINPGNSGGALLNTKGEVIGINSVKYSSEDVEGMGYAIPISKATPIINELMTKETLTEDEKGYLGVYIEAVNEETAQMYNWPLGIYVTATVKGGSAEKAGILAGDIITAVNGSNVSTSTQLQEKVTSFKVGTELTLTLQRSQNGKYVEKKVKVKLGAKPSEFSNSNN